jgi:tetratricopeptide (TPR) repeat protein
MKYKIVINTLILLLLSCKNPIKENNTYFTEIMFRTEMDKNIDMIIQSFLDSDIKQGNAFVKFSSKRKKNIKELSKLFKILHHFGKTKIQFEDSVFTNEIITFSFDIDEYSILLLAIEMTENAYKYDCRIDSLWLSDINANNGYSKVNLEGVDLNEEKSISRAILEYATDRFFISYLRLREALINNPEDYTANIQMGDLFYKLGDSELARTYYDKIMNKKFYGLDVSIDRYKIFMKYKNYDSALMYSNETLRIAPTNPLGKYYRYEALIKLGDTISACKDLNEISHIKENWQEEYNCNCKNNVH